VTTKMTNGMVRRHVKRERVYGRSTVGASKNNERGESDEVNKF